MLKADDFRTEPKEIFGWPVNITSYKIGQTYYCHIDNVDPGTTIVRTEGATFEEVMQAALSTAQERLTPKVK